MTDSAHDIYITGLRNAYALEGQAQELMERQLDRLENYPAMRERLARHLEETKVQRQRLEQILGRHNESPSTFKDMVTSFMGNMAAIGHSLASDEVMKNALANNAFENYEVATYKALLTMAEAVGDGAAIEPLQQSLREEQEMARWVDSHIGEVTLTYIERETAGLQAAR